MLTFTYSAMPPSIGCCGVKVVKFGWWVLSAIAFLAILAALTSIAANAETHSRTAVLWEEHYVVRDDAGAQILCDPYTVRPKDWLHKIFLRRGEIAEYDFRQFLKIFKRLNPHIPDINRILPGQLILIPLKKLDPEEVPDTATRQMTIPFAGFGDDSEQGEAYRVRVGDNLSALLAARGVDLRGDRAEAALRRFRALNPQIGDINRIEAGQTIYLPTARSTATTASTPAVMVGQTARANELGKKQLPLPIVSQSGRNTEIAENVAVLGRLLKMRTMTRGFLYFPMDERNDLRLELLRYPVLVLPEAGRFLFASDSDLPGASQLQVIRNYWPRLQMVKVGFEQEKILALLDTFCAQLKPMQHPRQFTIADNGVGVVVLGPWIVKAFDVQDARPTHHFIIPADNWQPSASDSHLANYLARHGVLWQVVDSSGRIHQFRPKSDGMAPTESFRVLETADAAAFVRDLATWLGWQYSTNVSVHRFSENDRGHAFAAMLTSSDGRMVIVDKGRLDPDAIKALSISGFPVVAMRNESEIQALINKLLTAMKVVFSVDPEFTIGSQAAQGQIMLQIRGTLAETQQVRLLLTHFNIDPSLIAFLAARDISVARLGQ
jgi:hypothetical protein